jgi:quercetin dioxygenase-like cupin family protein
MEIVTFADLPVEKLSRSDMTGTQDARHVLGAAVSGTPDIVADHVVTPPAFIHHMHRHPHADQLIIVFSGRLTLAAPDGARDVGIGQLAVVPRGEWHELRNVTEETAVSLVCFVGVGTGADAGYEEYAPPGDGGRARPRSPSDR